MQQTSHLLTRIRDAAILATLTWCIILALCIQFLLLACRHDRYVFNDRKRYIARPSGFWQGKGSEPK